MGLNDEDVELLNTVEHATVESYYSTDVVLSNNGITSKIYGLDLDKKQQLNKYTVLEGRLPEKSGEIAIDSTTTYKEISKLEIRFSWKKEQMKPMKKILINLNIKL